jgi:hypothetical protein
MKKTGEREKNTAHIQKTKENRSWQIETTDERAASLENGNIVKTVNKTREKKNYW